MKKENYYKILKSKIKKKKCLVGIIGIGFVGMKLMLQFNNKKIKTIGFDKDLKKINLLKRGISPYSYIKNKDIKNVKKFSSFKSNFESIDKCDVIIICLPTPVKKNTKPDLSNISQAIAQILNRIRPGQLLILESTTYPGTTRDIIAKKISLRFQIGNDYFVSFSPERENPGSNMKFENITKVCSGFSNKCLDLSKNLYQKIVKKIVTASSLEEAEMSKLLENIYRSVNIGLVNELKIISRAMKLNIHNIIKLASTKPFGFQSFYPGPGIGGHCIPIDPYYLYWRAREFNEEARFVKLAGEINVRTTNWTIKNIIKIIKKENKKNYRTKILILGLAYKKNIEDLRESAGIKIMTSLLKKKYFLEYSDPYVKSEVINRVRKKSIKINKKNIKKFDCVILVTDHDKYNYKLITKYSKILIDTRGKIYRKNNFFRL